MKKFLYCFTLILFCGSAIASKFIDLANEIRIPLPENWQLTNDSLRFPFQIVHVDQTAELLIYKSIIPHNDKVRNKQEFQESVDVIISEIILSLPNSKLLTNVGKIDGNRAVFSVEFVSEDSATLIQLNHRLNSYLYDHPNGDQLLFTLWGKTNSRNKELLDSEILLMQNSFSYYGKSHSSIFQTEQATIWKIIFIIISLIFILLFLYKKYKIANSNLWKCMCGNQNQTDQDSCNKCGQNKIIKITL